MRASRCSVRFGVGALLLAGLLGLSACATAPAREDRAQPVERGEAVERAERRAVDPFERTNRRVFAFNDALDRSVLKPAAVAYETHLPQPVRTAVLNFFGNLSDAWSAVNWLLQGEWHRAAEQGARVAWNSTLGLAGLIDVGTWMGLDKRSQDFGQTLGAWGVPSGPYLVLPLFGPSSVRDAAALPLNQAAGGNQWVENTQSRVALSMLDLVAKRGSLLGPERVLNDVALDRYVFLRDAYLQRRAAPRRQPQEDDDFEVVPTPATPAASAAR